MKNLKRKIRALKELVKEHHKNHESLDIILGIIVVVVIGAIIGFKVSKPIKLTSEETTCYKEIAEELLGNTELKDFLSKKEKYESNFKCSIDFDASKIEVTLLKDNRKESIRLTSEEISCYNEIIKELQKDTDLKDISNKIKKYENDFECSIDCNVLEIEVTSKNYRKESIIFKISSKENITSETSFKSANDNRRMITFFGAYLGLVICWIFEMINLIRKGIKKYILEIKEAYNKKLKKIEAKEEQHLDEHEEEKTE